MQNIGSLATIVGFYFWGGFLDRRGPLATVLAAIGINLAVPLLYAEAWSINALYFASLAMGICLAGVDLAYLNTTLLFAEKGKASQYQALHSSFFGIRGSIAPQCAVPMMRHFGAQRAFFISFWIIVAGVWLQIISMRDYRKEAKDARQT